MEQDKVGDTILSIECAVASGSIAVMRGASLLASASGEEQSPARAEEVLAAVRSTLERAGLHLSAIERITVSTGPGSYSGIRIGMATALGLSRALSKKALGVSVLDALALEPPESEKFVTAVAVGKRHTAWCLFESTEKGPLPTSAPSLETDEDFISKIAPLGPVPIIWSSDLSSRLGSHLTGDEMPTHVPERTIAELIGQFAQRFPKRTSLVPQYLRDQKMAQGG